MFNAVSNRTSLHDSSTEWPNQALTEGSIGPGNFNLDLFLNFWDRSEGYCRNVRPVRPSRRLDQYGE